MEVDTSLALGVRAAGRDPRYDEACKRLLAERQVLARILKGCLTEYADMPIDEVVACIEGDPRVGEEPVERDAQAARIAGLPTEDATAAEGTVNFDVLFDAIVPGTRGSEVVRLTVNVEAQDTHHPGYPLMRRAVYYCGRLLSRQGANEVTHSHYERVRKVCSVWVCTTPPVAYQGTVSRFSLAHEQLMGNAPYCKDDWDLVEIVMVGLSKEMCAATDGVVGFLGTLLSGNTTPQKRIDALRDDFGVAVTERITDGVNDMCNLSEGVWREAMTEGFAKGFEQGRDQGFAAGREQGFAAGREEGRALGRKQGREQGSAQGRAQGLEQGRAQGLEQGRAQGLEQGLEQGRIETLVATLHNVMGQLSVSAERAAEIVGVPEAERPFFLKQLSA